MLDFEIKDDQKITPEQWSKILKSAQQVKHRPLGSYFIMNESYEDDYGRAVSNYVPYFVGPDFKIKRLSSPGYVLSSYEADAYLRFGKNVKCKECGHVSFKLE